MQRRQLFEFQDQRWFPEVLREGQVEILSYAVRRSGLAHALAPAFAQWVAGAGGAPILDLCSGAGGPVVQLLAALAERQVQVPTVLLSDLYPQRPAWQRLRASWPERVDFVPEPVDATRLPDLAQGRLVTIINALHHFPLGVVRRILQQVTRQGAALFAAEGFPRSLVRAAAMAPSLGLGLLTNPFTCERQGLAKALWSLPLPVLTATGIWDWFASTLRIHDPAELVEEARAIAPGYRFYHGSASYPPWGRAVYLAGLPP